MGAFSPRTGRRKGRVQAGGGRMIGTLPDLTNKNDSPRSCTHPSMRIFQRFEVWLLLLVAAVAIGWSFLGGEPAPDGVSLAPLVEDAALQVRRATLERDVGNARLDLEIRYKNTSPRPLFLQPPDVRLLNAAGKEVPVFILPTERPASVEAQTTGDVRLRFWLEKPDLAGELSLEIRDQKVPVKDSTPLDLEKLPDRKPKAWSGLHWTP